MNINNSELKLMKLIWQYEPVKSGELVALAYNVFKWKKSTVYTIIRKLSDKGAILSKDAVVTSVIKRENALYEQSENVIESRFGGSLPMFLTAFLSKERLTQAEADELKHLIDSYTEVTK